MTIPGRKQLYFAVAVVALTSVMLMDSRAQVAPSPEVIEAFTQPVTRRKMNFNSIGLIRTVAVKEGQIVKKGDLLLAQDDDIERDELERLTLEAENTARRDLYVATLEWKKTVYKRKSQIVDGRMAFSAAEVEEADQEVKQADAQIKVTELDTQGNKLRAKQQKTKLEKMVMKSEVNGVVEKINVREGELTSVDPDKPAIIVVENDPCLIFIRQLKTWQVARLTETDTLEVKYPDETAWQKAKIVYIAPVADAASKTQEVRLELANPTNRRTGLPISVKLPAKLLQTGNAAADVVSR